MNNPEILRYKNNKLPYSLCLLAIVLQCIAFIIIYSRLTFDAQFNTGLDIIINIIFLLVTFLLAEKIKTYDVNSGIFAIVVGCVNLVRIYTYLFNPYSGEFLYQNIKLVYIIISVACYVAVAVLMTFSGIITIIKGNTLKNFLNSIGEGK